MRSATRGRHVVVRDQAASRFVRRDHVVRLLIAATASAFALGTMIGLEFATAPQFVVRLLTITGAIAAIGVFVILVEHRLTRRLDWMSEKLEETRETAEFAEGYILGVQRIPPHGKPPGRALHSVG